MALEEFNLPALKRREESVILTTSSFSQPAIEYAKSYPHATILLIDGKKLTELMIEYNIGVSDARTVTIKKIDSDYFDL
ncbi:restriction endonuclease [Butyrivibrio sp. INlla16]|uniref:restriction endonuclease n=1 Tax=Butyrivibrio sp. INlla16 TaxID=1520807 RepID=UPI000A5C024B|nr:restriction endonuclease [Butyrivibrio sp. INlla16]